MVANINSGSIFWLLPLNIVLMSMSMYNIEIVCFQIHSEKFYFNLIKSIPFSIECSFCVGAPLVTAWFGEFAFSIDLYGMLIVLAIFTLLLCFFDHTANWRHCDHGLLNKLLWYAHQIAKVYHFDDDSCTANTEFHRIENHLLYHGNTWKGIQINLSNSRVKTTTFPKY